MLMLRKDLFHLRCESPKSSTYHPCRKEVSWEANAPGRKELSLGSIFQGQKGNKWDWTPGEELRMRLERQAENN